MSIKREFASVLRLLFAVLFVCITSAGCATPQALTSDRITVEGLVTARGNEPFVERVLETDGHLYYVLKEKDTDRSLSIETPSRYRITGILYRADWNGRPFAHLHVEQSERLD